jgi:hypothetical protein
MSPAIQTGMTDGLRNVSPSGGTLDISRVVLEAMEIAE